MGDFLLPCMVQDGASQIPRNTGCWDVSLDSENQESCMKQEDALGLQITFQEWNTVFWGGLITDTLTVLVDGTGWHFCSVNRKLRENWNFIDAEATYGSGLDFGQKFKVDKEDFFLIGSFWRSQNKAFNFRNARTVHTSLLLTKLLQLVLEVQFC